MEPVIWILAAVGSAFILFWVGSALLGVFGNKIELGIHQTRKLLKEQGIDPNQFSNNQLNSVADNALSVATYSGREIGKYDATEYMRQLEFRAWLIAAYVKKEPLDKDSASLIKSLLEKE